MNPTKRTAKSDYGMVRLSTDDYWNTWVKEGIGIFSLLVRSYLAIEYPLFFTREHYTASINALSSGIALVLISDACSKRAFRLA